MSNRSNRRSAARSWLFTALPAALLAASVLALQTGCGFISERLERRNQLSESKRVSDCRWKARRACRKLAELEEALNVDECVSERSWR